jgi:hypothetical protein
MWTPNAFCLFEERYFKSRAKEKNLEKQLIAACSLEVRWDWTRVQEYGKLMI